MMVVTLLIWSPAVFRESSTLRVVFFDVGQGDAIFIESPNGTQVLIDGGPNNSVLRRLGEEMSFFDRTIDIIVATHPDSDHISGLIDVLERYRVNTIIVTENSGESNIAKVFDTKKEEEGAEIITARRGMSIDLGDGVVMEILFPDRDVRSFESNTASIVVRIVYGENEFLLTGDSPKAIEEYLADIDGKKLQSDVLKVGHHGSRTSTSKLFLGMVQPAVAIISAGKDNRYGHPHSDVIELLMEHKIEIKNTAEIGSIVFESNGNEISISNY